jgi:hypothetical protein
MLIEASYALIRRYNQTPEKVLSIIGAVCTYTVPHNVLYFSLDE